MKIEDLWTALRREALAVQRRVDASHPLDLYADFEPPAQPGLVLFCDEQPNESPSMQAIGIDRRRRHDGRWALRVFLEEPRLFTVFSELCRDIIESTRQNPRAAPPSTQVLSRIERWRSLLQPQSAALSRTQLRGLIGELLVLRELITTIGSDRAVSAWIGPLGASQDFQLPDGRRLEVKAVDRNAETTLINGLEQLDAGNDPLELVVVRLDETGIDAADALTVSRLIAELRNALAGAPAAILTFEGLIRFVGWDDGIDTDSISVRLERIDRLPVGRDFPRLIASNVPRGVSDVVYRITLPPPP